MMKGGTRRMAEGFVVVVAVLLFQDVSHWTEDEPGEF